MIYLGLSDLEKAQKIAAYVSEHDIEKVIVFSPEKIPFELPPKVDGVCFGTGRWYSGEIRTPAPDALRVDYYGWNDIIMYRCFYPLLEEISAKYLIVSNELVNDKDRGCLTYNCLHHYLNQTKHRMSFSFVPFTNTPDDYMILVDQVTPYTYKAYQGQGETMGFSNEILSKVPVTGKAFLPAFEVITVSLPEDAQAAYEKEKARLFDNLGQKDPNSLPRQLHLWAGRYRREFLTQNETWWARNARMKLPNVMPITKANELCPVVNLLDSPASRADLVRFLRITRPNSIRVLSTGLNVDAIYTGDIADWLSGLEEFYAAAGIHA